MRNPFRYFNSSPEVIRLTVMMYIRYPLSLRQVEDILFERGIDICHETVRYWWNWFGPMFTAAIRKRRLDHRSFSQWRWHLDEVFVRINGETHYLWRAVDHEGEVLEVFATKRRDRKAALKFLKRMLKRYGRPGLIVTDRLRSYGAAMKVIGNVANQECGRWLNNRAENSHQLFRRRERAMAKFRDMKTLQKFAATTPRSTITSTLTVTSTAATSSNRTALLHSQNGVDSPRESLDDLRSTSSRPITLTMPCDVLHRGLAPLQYQLARVSRGSRRSSSKNFSSSPQTTQKLCGYAIVRTELCYGEGTMAATKELTSGQKAAQTRKRRATALKAAATRKRRATAAKAAATRKKNKAAAARKTAAPKTTAKRKPAARKTARK